MMRIGVIGATGYVGQELCRWILAHPQLELAAACSRSAAGKPLGDVIPALDGLTALAISDVDCAALSSLDAVVLATPHGAAAPLVAQLGGAPILIDCSRDHRHASGWVYGQPEWNREQLHEATRIAVPGCFATAIGLALAPLAAAGVLPDHVQVVAATGSTGSGAGAKAATHHPERFANLKAYKVLAHQHVPEIRGFLGQWGAAPDVAFVPLSAPIDRGILATTLVRVSDVNAAALFADAYADEPLIRLRRSSPEVRLVRGTAFCDIAVHQDGDTVAVISAIDNLGRGAAAQSIQCLNLALGLPEQEGLMVPACAP